MPKRTIVIIPPGGNSVKAIHIRFSFVIALLFFIIIGIAGFFIPLDQYKQSQDELNQTRELAKQNKKIHQYYTTTIQTLNMLKSQVSRLEKKEEDVALLTGTRSNKEQKSEGFDFTEMNGDKLGRYLQDREQIFQKFQALVNSKKNVFDYVPVVKPVLGPSSISLSYGMSKDPFTGKTKMHYGADFISHDDAPIIATASGTVVKTETSPLWGKRVVIRHGNGIETIYAHLGSIQVGSGRQVKRGDVIGVMGTSGLSTGPHVHYEIVINNRSVDPETMFFPN